MKLYDLSHLLNNYTPVFPGSKNPDFTPVAEISIQGYRETLITINSHLGTHIDAPAHILEKGLSLDMLPLDSFTGQAIIINVPEKVEIIDSSFLENYWHQILQIDFVLFRTNWSRHWGTDTYQDSFPVVDSEAMARLTSLGLKGIGFDTISADPIESTTLDNHHLILEKGMIIIENLQFPEDLKGTSGRVFGIPFRY